MRGGLPSIFSRSPKPTISANCSDARFTSLMEELVKARKDIEDKDIEIDALTKQLEVYTNAFNEATKGIPNTPY